MCSNFSHAIMFTLKLTLLVKGKKFLIPHPLPAADEII